MISSDATEAPTKHLSFFWDDLLFSVCDRFLIAGLSKGEQKLVCSREILHWIISGSKFKTICDKTRELWLKRFDTVNKHAQFTMLSNQMRKNILHKQ